MTLVGGKTRSQALTMLFAGVVAFASACDLVRDGSGGSGAKRAESGRPNVILLTLDTTRADHLGCYGYAEARTPNIDRLAAEGVVFENAVAQAPLTLPSHASLLTGTYPFAHGVRDNGGFYLEERFLTLAEMLQANGYTTAAFVGAFVVDSRWGLAQGFDHYDDRIGPEREDQVTLDSVQRRGEEVVQAFFRWLERGPSPPFFAWLHFYDPHAPYEPPEPFRSEHAGRPGGLYHGEIAYVDSLVGRVREELQKKSLFEDSVMALIGDHGESLGEHEEWGHGLFVYDPTLLVPWILRLPSSEHAGKRLSVPVETVDLVPTLLEAVDLPIFQGIQGRSLLPLVVAGGEPDSGLCYFETWFPFHRYGWASLKGVRSSRYKYIEAPDPELYDLVGDPQERENVYSARPDVVKELSDQLARREELRTADTEGIEGTRILDEESMEKLAALGYWAGFHSPTGEARDGTLVDPKDRVGVFNRIRQAEAMFSEGRLGGALSEITAVLQEDLGSVHARHVRAQIYLKQGSAERAVADCREALRVDPSFLGAWFTLAHAYRLSGQIEQSIATYQRLARLEPKDHKPHLNLGKLYLERGELDPAIFHLGESVRLDPERSAMAHNLLGAAYIAKEEWGKVENELRKAIALRPWIRDAHYNLGLLYDRQGDVRRAIEELEREIKLYPQSYRAHFHLANVFDKLGRRDEKIRHLEEVIRYKEDFANAYLMLGKSYLDSNRELARAIELTQKGLALAPTSEFAPFGHFVLADLYRRLGRMDDYYREKGKGEELQARLGQRK